MRTSPTPPVSRKEMHPVLVHAFMWRIIRALKSAGVLSIKLTVSLRDFGPQYLAVMTAMRRGSWTWNRPATAFRGPKTGAFAGLIVLAVSAAFTSNRFGSDLMT